MTDLRSTQQIVEVISSSEPHVRSTQQVVETLISAEPSIRSTQQVLEALYTKRVAGSDAIVGPMGLWKNRRLTALEITNIYSNGRALLFNSLPVGLRDNLVAYWDFNEISGDLLDNYAGLSRQYTSANSEYHSIADNASLSTGNIDFTFACWVRLDSKATDQGIAAKFDVGQREWELRYDTSSDQFAFSVSADGTVTTPTVFNSTTPININTWYFLEVTHTAGGLLRIFVDGAISSTASSGAVDGTSLFRLGSTTVATNFLDGRLSRAGFWKRDLTNDERTWLRNSGHGRRYDDLGVAGNNGSNLLTDLTSYWNLDEADNDALDSHGVNHLTDNVTVTSSPGVASQDGADNGAILSGVGPGTSSVLADHNDPVEEWVDSGGSSFTQTNKASQPIFTDSSVGTQPGLDFDGINDFLSVSTGLLTGSKGTIFCVFLHDTLQGSTVFSSSDEDTASDFIEFRSYYQVADPNILINTDSNATKGSTEILNSTAYVVAYTSSGTSYSVRVNGIQDSVSAEVGVNNGDWFADIANLENLVIGARKTSSTSQYMNGKIAEVIVYDDITLSTTDIQDLENSLASKYGITLG